MALLRVEGVRKAYGSLEVLKGIDLDIHAGEVVAIVGASGAGKSTLLHIMGTLDKPDQGSVTMKGVDLFRLSEKALAELRNKEIGFIFQFHNLLPEFTALENVYMPALIGKFKDETKLKARALELLQTLGLEARANHFPSQMSGGEQQRVAVARALMNAPAIIFADEPSGNLDSHNAEELHKLFFKLKDDLGHTFVIITHNEQLAEMADRRLVMKDGLLVNS